MTKESVSSPTDHADTAPKANASSHPATPALTQRTLRRLVLRQTALAKLLLKSWPQLHPRCTK